MPWIDENLGHTLSGQTQIAKIFLKFQKQIVKPWILPKNKQMNSFLLVYDIFSFVFFEENEDSKKAFRNYLTFSGSFYNEVHLSVIW